MLQMIKNAFIMYNIIPFALSYSQVFSRRFYYFRAFIKRFFYF